MKKIRLAGISGVSLKLETINAMYGLCSGKYFRKQLNNFSLAKKVARKRALRDYHSVSPSRHQFN